ncbi:MAG: APC family permease [Kordiimonadaceae bacterium]|nr:APC family permease [Kordiimonadaceae bacterium]
MRETEEVHGNDAKLKREIGLIATGFLVLNGSIGAGIFGLPGKLMEQAGVIGPWLIIIFGTFIITVAWTFAAIASYFSSTGGPVAYANRAFGPLVGFQTGWLLYVGRVTAIAANVNVLFNYAAYLWESASSETIRMILFFIIIGTLTVINVMGIKKAVKAINVLTLLKTIPVLLLVLLALPYITPEGTFPKDLPSFDDMNGLVLLILYAFVGFEGALVTAGETKNPKKTIPRALIMGVLVITALYFLVSLAYANVVDDISSDIPLLQMAEILMGGIGGVLIIITAIFSILGNATSIVIAAPRMTFAMAEEGSLPKWFSDVNEKYKTPANSIVFLGVLAFLLAISGTFVKLAIASTLARMIAYAICMLSLPNIRKKADQETRDNATKLPGGYIIPGVAFIVCLFAISQSTWVSWKYTLGLILLGSFLYYLNKMIGKKESTDE